MSKPPLPTAQRRYPRVELRVQARLSVTGDPFRTFQAVLATRNISVGGIFFDSTFFLKVGMQLDVDLELPFGGPSPSRDTRHVRRVRVRGEVVRVESSNRSSGFALRFTEYFEGSDVVLANFFLAPVLREFIVGYAKKHRFDASPEYVAHTADVLAAWELEKANEQPAWSSVLTKADGEEKPVSSAKVNADREADRTRWKGDAASGVLAQGPSRVARPTGVPRPSAPPPSSGARRAVPVAAKTARPKR